MAVASPRLLLPDVPALVAAHGRATLLTPDGEVLMLTGGHIAQALAEYPPPMLVHAPSTAKRLDLPRFLDCFDLLELFAFALPGRSAPPTPRGLALVLDLPPPEDDEAAAALLPEIASRLLRALADEARAPSGKEAAGMAAQLAGAAQWPWVPSVLAALGQPDAKPDRNAFKTWRRLPEWEETAPPMPPASHEVSGAEARRRLAEMLGGGAEQRPQQADFASAAAGAFAPREAEGAPHMILAEAGTGTGKTLGYIAPASLWAERNGAPVWLSTYTRNLQRQIDQELMQLFPDPEERRARVAVRKGRENYLCLLNLEEALGQSAMRQMALPLALVARWAGATRDGDIQGGDFPGWIGELFPPGSLTGLADRRGECIRSACAHYKKCFVEHSIRRARTARLVVANHALVMVQAALGGGEDGKPTRYVFDEGHHLFDAADSAFSAALTGVEAAELRRWLLGAEGGRSRAKGLRARIQELAGDIPQLIAPMEEALHAARCLPGGGWYARMGDGVPPPDGNATEAFLHAARQQILARAVEDDGIYTLEVDLHPVSEAVLETGAALAAALHALEQPLTRLRDALAAKLETPEGEEEPEVGERIRLETAMRGIERRALMPLGAWRGMLGQLSAPQPEPGMRPVMVDWLQLDRREGRDVDAGLHRHWLDPTIPFAQVVAAPAHGLLVTSATLTDAAKRNDPEAAWREAEARTGAAHLPLPAIRAALPSPFDYAANTRTFIVTDVDARQSGPVASAMQQLFLASGGGALGLFTAIRRLREVAHRIAPALEARGIPLYAQHVDAMDNATLVDIFRAEENSCLLGTDAMRDGVDVPGRALRLLVFDRVPWPRRTILHRERRLHLGEGAPQMHDDTHARHKLRQAFGRLVRRADDKGVFVLLDRACPSRILAGLPEGVTPERVRLAEAVARTRELLSP
ncbi:ATP-dependent DNA helicase [Roseococcus sp. SDR]|uniref:ATP-dependent DNA helicase n=1 Tax=Roseococcus sp. SDR TaxID=2835532 RepID=UPI001BCD76F2|nr:ATP-dependent DNA helicase [Roseococcus sp. SDR]MBS7790249.1 ATP-dependent DNA helicase [Roseococcus sp. SDR]MBV1845563.1 ATP-dependent DNA helicase [Roseococcus sp. SDR]